MPSGLRSPPHRVRFSHFAIDLVHPPHSQILYFVDTVRTALRMPGVRSENADLPALRPHSMHLISSQPERSSSRFLMISPGRQNLDFVFAVLLAVFASPLVTQQDGAQSPGLLRGQVEFVEEEDEDGVARILLRNLGEFDGVLSDRVHWGDFARQYAEGEESCHMAA
jgi:hypothetical protein